MFYKTEGPFTLLPHCLSFSILPFNFSSSLLVSLWPIHEPGIQTPIRWLFWGASLPSCWSAGSPIWSLFLASTPRLSDSLAPCVASRASLDSVMPWPAWNSKRVAESRQKTGRGPRQLGGSSELPSMTPKVPWPQPGGTVIRSGVQFRSIQFTQSCLTLCNHMDCSTPGFPVHHHLLEFTQTHDYWVGDAIQPSRPLSAPSPPAFNLSQHQSLFQWVSSLHQVAKVLEFWLQHQPF